ncbi:MAG: (2Fe-2S)-binding protein [Phycisphaeraceae bacterium]|nr:(2Fe-2S)-binding protein [Phycisphaeraceae bacterium]
MKRQARPARRRKKRGHEGDSQAMTAVNITINDRKVQAQAGQTVLAAATEAGIDIPVLCHHPALPAHGGCRMCVVEIERQRALQPSCTFPVAEGLVIQTESPRVIASRKFVLEMLFSERLHYCMYCAASGGEHTSDCELQKLAYRYGLECWKYAPKSEIRWPVDASRAHMVMDHARCILCRRCVRACGDLAANHTLGVQQRGARTMICADDDVPFGASTCVSCGTCLQVCPTGAIMDRRSAFLGHPAEVQRTRTTCMGCAVACPIETVTRSNHLLRVEGVFEGPNRGVLCEDGRFKVLDSPLPRLPGPMIKKNGKAVECGWDEALQTVAQKLAGSRQVAGLVSPRITSESMTAFTRLFHDIFKSNELGLLHGEVPPLDLGAPGGVEDVAESDCLVVIGGDPSRKQKVLAYLTKRAVDRGAKLIVVNDGPTDLEDLAELTIRLEKTPEPASGPMDALRFSYHLRADRIAQVKIAVESAQRPLVMYGCGLDEHVYTALRALPSRTKFLPLVDGANAVGAARQGLTVRPVQGEILYVLAGDDVPNGDELPPAKFTVVQGSYRSAWSERADVALPAKIWFEKKGHMMNLEGVARNLSRSTEAPGNILPDWAILFMISVKMGQPLNCVTVSENAWSR